MRSATRALVTALLFSSLGTTGVFAQSPSEILGQMTKAYSRMMDGIDDYTVWNPFATQYFVRETSAEGRPVFRMSKTIVGGRTIPVGASDASEQNWDGFYTRADELAQYFRYEGRDEVNGHGVHVLVADDPEAIDLAPPKNTGPEQGDQDFRAEKMSFHVERDLWVIRRMVFDGQMVHEGETHDVKSIVELDDYRKIGGMLHPFRTTVTMEGMAEATGVTAEDMAQMEEAMDQMPEAHKRAMKKQLEAMKNMLSGQGGFVLEVDSVKVNSGPPSR